MNQLQQLAEKIEALDNALARVESQTYKLAGEVQLLRDVQRSAQYLVDTIHTQGSGTSGGPFQVAYDNLREALKSYYQPNGPSTPQPH